MSDYTEQPPVSTGTYVGTPKYQTELADTGSIDIGLMLALAIVILIAGIGTKAWVAS